MKLRYSNGWNFKRFTLVVGGSLTRFGFGFCISRWQPLQILNNNCCSLYSPCLYGNHILLSVPSQAGLFLNLGITTQLQSKRNQGLYLRANG